MGARPPTLREGAAHLDLPTRRGYASDVSEPARKRDESEPLTAEQRAAVEAWKAAGCPEQPEVAALRKKIRGEPLTPDEAALIVPTPETRARIAALGRGIAHAQVTAELAERQRRGG